MKHLITAAIVAIVCVGSVTESQAGGIWDDIRKAGRDFDNARLDRMTPSVYHRAGRDYTRLHVRNHRNRTVWVTLYYYNDLQPVNGQTVGSSWVMAGWYKLAPGERAHLANVTGANYFVSAHEAGGREFMTVTDTFFHHRDRRQTNFQRQSIGNQHSRKFTLNIR